jgi:penicillin-binding protein 2
VELIKRAMYGVTQEGTSTRVFAGAPYKSGGKTGTAQAVTVRQNERYNAARLAEHQRDHSLYLAFAPLEAPTIALAVIVENAGFGAAAAAPIARRVFDYWLLGNYPSEADVAATRRGESVAPTGAPRRAEDVPLPGNADVAAGLVPPQSLAQGAAVEVKR